MKTPEKKQAYLKEYREKNRERINARQMERYNADKGKYSVKRQEWHDNNKEHLAAYYEANKAAIRARQNARAKKTVRTCRHCKEVLPVELFIGRALICNECKEKSKAIQGKTPKPPRIKEIKVGRKRRNPIKFKDEKHSNERVKLSNYKHEKRDVLPEKTVKVKLKIEDKLGRTNKIVGKNWAKQLAEIKLKCQNATLS